MQVSIAASRGANLKEIGMFFSGIADEAGKELATQIKAHQELGWNYIELRNVGATQFTDLSDADFAQACAALDAAKIKISCYASGIANWACKITDPREKDQQTLKRAIPRMQKTDTKFIRIMSYPNNGLSDADWQKEAVARLKELAKIAADGGVVLALENCDGWGSASAANYGRIFELVGSPALKAVYDTGNPASHGHSDTWDWYKAAKPHIAYIHIKAHTGPKSDTDKGEHVFCDLEGASRVRDTLKDLFAAGYDGGISIEPHLKAVIHEGKAISEADAAYRTYVEYGQRLMKLIKEVKGK